MTDRPDDVSSSVELLILGIGQIVEEIGDIVC